MTLVSIISVNYNQPAATVDFLNSVRQHYSGFDLELILVDNGSKDDCKELFESQFPNLRYIRSEKNLGFAGGNNLGLKVARGEYLLLLNNDTELVPGFIEKLISEMEKRPEIGLISPLIMYHENKQMVQYAGYTSMNYLTARNSCIGQFEINRAAYERSYETAYCHGAAMMCRATDFKKIGFMDETYFLYYEELDWCEKFKKMGKKMWFCGYTYIYHKESVSVGKESALKTYFMTRNRLLFIRKNTGIINTFIFWCYYSLIACPRTMISLASRNYKNLVPWVLKGLLWNFSHKKNRADLGYPGLEIHHKD